MSHIDFVNGVFEKARGFETSIVLPGYLWVISSGIMIIMIINVQCTVYSVRCTVYGVQCTLYRRLVVECMWYVWRCWLEGEVADGQDWTRCTVHGELCTMYCLCCTVYSVQFTLYSVHVLIEPVTALHACCSRFSEHTTRHRITCIGVYCVHCTL